jgi:hypothetical protein
LPVHSIEPIRCITFSQDRILHRFISISAAQAISEYLQSTNQDIGIHASEARKRRGVDWRKAEGRSEIQILATRDGLCKPLGARRSVQTIKGKMSNIDWEAAVHCPHLCSDHPGTSAQVRIRPGINPFLMRGLYGPQKFRED